MEKLRTQGLKSLLLHKEYSKYLRIKAEKPQLDEDRIRAEEIFDGKFVLRTNPNLDWREVIGVYRDLWQVEAAFRVLPSTTVGISATFLTPGRSWPVPVTNHKDNKISSCW